MRRIAAVLAEEAEHLIRDQVWKLTPKDHALAGKTTAGLREAVGPPDVQEALPPIDRLEHLRETLAVLAISLARTHGRLSWFLSGAFNALEPVLRCVPSRLTLAAPSAPSSRVPRNTQRRRMPSADSTTPSRTSPPHP